MKIKSLMGIGCLMACIVCPAAFAKDGHSRYEIFLGYSLLKVGEYDDTDYVQQDMLVYLPNTGRIKRSSFLERGFSTSFTYNFASSVGLETSLRLNNGYILSLMDRGIGFESEQGYKRTNVALLVGPRIKLRNASNSLEPFVYGLAGLSHDRVSLAADILHWGYPGSMSEKLNSNTSLGFAVGGGLDIPVHENVSIRLIQADYYWANHPANLREAANENKKFNNFNLSFGLAFSFGR
jgi:opacity protein-like surface antigen